MTTTNARDFSVDAGRLRNERCKGLAPGHRGWTYYRSNCQECLTLALAAAYGAGRADAAAANQCFCANNPEPFRCGCCGAEPGEPCRHTVKP